MQVSPSDMGKIVQLHRKVYGDRGRAVNERRKISFNGDFLMVKITTHTEGEGEDAVLFTDLVGDGEAYSQICDRTGALLDNAFIKVRGWGLQGGTVAVGKLIGCQYWNGEWLAMFPQECPT